MTTPIIQPLESLRLAQYAMPVPCYICGTDNTLDAEFCTHCAAPMALAHQAVTQQIAPQMVATMGASGAGKTVYLGMLIDMLSQRPDAARLLARGAFSITLQQSTISALGQCEFPDKTPNEPDHWNWVHCQVRKPEAKQPMELIMPDMAGEALLAEIDHPRTYRVVRAFLAKSAGALILVDAVKMVEGIRREDFFTMKLLSYLSELSVDGRTGWCDRPLAIVFTKADQCEECAEDPAAFAREHAIGLWEHCRERFRRHRFFAAGVAGSCAMLESFHEGRQAVPLRVEPHGVIEPFLWLLEQLPARKRGKSALQWKKS